MAETGIFCSGAHVLRKAGINYSISGANVDNYNDFISQAESYINVATKYNFSDNYSGLNTDAKEVLKEAASNLAAIYVINFDIRGLGSTETDARLISEDRIDVLYLRAKDCIELLKNQDKVDFIKNA